VHGPAGARPSQGAKGAAAAAGAAGAAAAGASSQTQKAKAKAQAKAQQLAEAAEPPAKVPAADGPRGTLIVCPLSVLSNWQQQLEEHTAGNLKVCGEGGAGGGAAGGAAGEAGG
jgi:SWI/SNF-related matrix-associated actin-dependent regulator of chromatin subfamily A3